MLGSSEEPGVIPRAVREVFNLVKAKNEDEGWDYSIGMSYLEIYNEKVWLVAITVVCLIWHFGIHITNRNRLAYVIIEKSLQHV